MKHITFAIDMMALIQKSFNGEFALKGESTLRKQHPDYIKQLYASFIPFLDNIADEMSKDFGRKVRYKLFDKSINRIDNIDLSEIDIQNVGIDYLAFVAFYAEPDFNNKDAIYSVYQNKTICMKIETFNYTFDFPKVSLDANLSTTIKVYLRKFNNEQLNRLDEINY